MPKVIYQQVGMVNLEPNVLERVVRLDDGDFSYERSFGADSMGRESWQSMNATQQVNFLRRFGLAALEKISRETK